MINRARVEYFETLQIQIIPSIVANEFFKTARAAWKFSMYHYFYTFFLKKFLTN